HPTMIHAGVYAGTLHYLKAVEALKSDDGAKVIAKMKELPTDDPLFGKGTIRADGRKIHPAYLVEVKKPAESKYPWDHYKIRATIPAEQAFRPLDPGGCETVTNKRGAGEGCWDHAARVCISQCGWAPSRRFAHGRFGRVGAGSHLRQATLSMSR